MIRIAVCDDEPVFAGQISRKIKEYMPECEIREFLSGAELLKYGGLFDICFLDIQMENIDGIETARKLREQDEESIIVFITGAKEYVFDAFDVAAMHYLVKPVDDEKLKEVLARAESEIRKKRERKNRKIFVKIRNKNIILNTSDIMYFENEMRKISAHTVKGEITFYGIMADMEEQAGDSFFRCHRAYLINLSYVAEYDKDSIILTNGKKLYLSRERYRDFVKRYMRYLSDGGGSDD